MPRKDSRTFDIVVFGATGYTGSKIVQELVLSGFLENEGGTVALAGRRLDSLRAVEERVVGETSLDTALVPQIGLIEANTSDEESLRRMAKQARVCINAVGPFRFHGRQVVRACIEEGCSYLDICGEPEFIEAIELEYDDEAREKGVFVASACGFDSVPVDIGNALVRSAFPAKRCCSVETFIELHSGPSGLVLHYPTYASAVHGLGSVEKLRAIRKALRAKTAEVGKSAYPVPMRRTGSYAKEVDKYVIPFIGADASVVKRSERASGFHPSTFVYMCLPSKFRLWQFGLYGSLFKLLAAYDFGRSLLLSYPRLFCPIVSQQGPSPDQLRETTFKVTILGKGFLHDQDGGARQDADKAPADTVKLQISGPEPGYLTCSICIVAAAKVLIRGELGAMPGGVYTPAGLLMAKETSFLRLVKQRGLTFEGLGD